MGAMNACFLSASTGTARATAALRGAFADGEAVANARFVGVQLPLDAWRAPEAALADLSGQLEADVIWLGFQSAVDAFQYHHWRDGVTLRSLVHGCFGEERIWDRAEGAEEPWEAGVIFEDALLEDLLSGAETAEERAEYARIWREREISPGRSTPFLSADGAAGAVIDYFGLP